MKNQTFLSNKYYSFFPYSKMWSEIREFLVEIKNTKYPEKINTTIRINFERKWMLKFEKKGNNKLFCTQNANGCSLAFPFSIAHTSAPILRRIHSLTHSHTVVSLASLSKRHTVYVTKFVKALCRCRSMCAKCAVYTTKRTHNMKHFTYKKMAVYLILNILKWSRSEYRVRVRKNRWIFIILLLLSLGNVWFWPKICRLKVDGSKMIVLNTENKPSQPLPKQMWNITILNMRAWH